MTPLRASVVVVSRGRPDMLRLCLSGLARLRHAEYEIIVVADPPGMAMARDLPFAAHLKLVAFDRPNISEARNLGIAEAAGDIVAFIDDDAVPEPRWLDHLLRAFHQPKVAAAGGFVRGRNGISFQWQARTVDCTGHASPVQVDHERITILTPPTGQAVKTEGTNMAVRRTVLADLGGFDPAFRFYMDETDLNMRLAKTGHSTAIVPLAQVHHAFAPSIRRTPERAVTDLHEIGASQMVFLRKHCDDKSRWPTVIDAMRREQNRRLLQQMVDGLIEPRDVRRVLASLDAGLADGDRRALPSLPRIPSASRGFAAFPSMATGEATVLGGRFWSRPRLRRVAADYAAQGATVSLFVFSHTGLFHSVRFLPEGVWLQRGGLWGRSERGDPLWRWSRFSTRLKREVARIEHLR